MLTFLLGISVGLLVGWNLLSQPTWVKNGLEKIREKIGF